ncbi:zygote arrest protein 1 [Anoplopoma fimbria]|uniref:zygote arrest protein 1 n=1 Tax=Anoplopoma fimbria TaxID=229290 RepID=UPI0023EC67C5|nr:zygote arrest protein 1 [Anoplopoma fimbria]
MAMYGEEPVDSYFYSSSYGPFPGRFPRHKDPGWRYKGYLSHCGEASDAFNNQQRAQLKSILSQINPKLTPRLRKANTKDVSVQVNPRKDASVQCAIGPRTLLAWKRDSRRRGRQEPDAMGISKTPGGVRYPRTLAVYSPIAYRSVTSFLVDENNNNSNTSSSKEACGGDGDTGRPPGDPPDFTHRRTGEGGGGGGGGDGGGDGEKKLQEKGDRGRSSPQESTLLTAEGSKGRARVRFQFLEQKYGYYHCRECNLRWESAYVWCVQGTNKVYFKQYCRKCQKDFNPYRVEDITCHTCNKARCCCALTQRHVDPKRPHRQDLCGRCKGKRLSCESTFSFKYII